MNIFKLIIRRHLVVQVILLILLFFSVFSWTIIIFKRKALRIGGRSNPKKFLRIFKKSRNLTEVHEAAKTYPGEPPGLDLPGRLQGNGLPGQEADRRGRGVERRPAWTT